MIELFLLCDKDCVPYFFMTDMTTETTHVHLKASSDWMPFITLKIAAKYRLPGL